MASEFEAAEERFTALSAQFDSLLAEARAMVRGLPPITCPECASTETEVCRTVVTGIDTNYKACLDCGHMWDIE